MLITLNQLKTSLLAFKNWVLARIPGKTSDLTNDSGFITAEDETVKDVQISGISIINDGVVNIPIASTSREGLVKIGSGLLIDNNKKICINTPPSNVIKSGTVIYAPITASNQHEATFYGLAKAAGHDEKDSANPVGTYTEEAKTAIRNMLDVPSVDDIPEAPVQDVQVNNASLLDSEGVANIPIASTTDAGVVKIGSVSTGLKMVSEVLYVTAATPSMIKNGSPTMQPIIPASQHESVFYGLAKAAGHDEKESANPVGTYTDEAKTAIQTMLGVPSTADIPTKVSDLVDDSGHYTKPSTGIPASDLASGVIPTVPVQDVTVNGTSVVSNGIAEIVQTDKSVWNMFVGTLNPDVSSADKYPHVDGQAVATMFRSCTPSVAEHGFRATATGMMRVDFGKENKSNLNGFEVGETYTLSCDLSANIIRPSSLDEVVANIEIQLLTYNGYYGIADGYVSRNIEDSEYGTDVDFGRVEFTFTVPERKDGMATTGAMIRIVPIINGTYALTEAGSYVEVRNLMLNKGNGASSWSPSLSEVVSEPPVQDVQINGTSIVDNGVANIPVSSTSNFGVAKTNTTNGVYTDANGVLTLSDATDLSLRLGNNTKYAVNTARQHAAAFYGLAKAAGDTTQSAASSNPVGTYTDEAKSAIQTMLGVDTVISNYDSEIKEYIDARSAAGSTIVSVSGTTPTISADAGSVYVCSELTSLNFTPPNTGVTTVVFTSGSTATELTLPSTVKMPDWFVMEANRVYEISISLGQYGSVMSWAV